jgi:starch phosphorylase
MAISPYYLQRLLPKGLENLADLAFDLRWSWSHATDKLWERIDPELWNTTGNPWLILQMVATTRLEELGADPGFRKLLDDLLTAQREGMEEAAWFQQTYPDSPLSIAYFSMEFGLSEAIPIYSGGLGILAGDYLKTASDLGVPVVGIGILYQQGYFRQALDARGSQMEFYPYNDPSQLPVLPVRDQKGEWLRVSLDFPGRRLWLRVWEARVGRVKLYLLDSNDPLNSPADRGITSELYGGGPELRLQQEIVLGIGGLKTLHALGEEPSICHLNEGHAALAVIEWARDFMETTGCEFKVAMAATRSANVFTTHTPVEAGFDRFDPELIGYYLGNYTGSLGIGVKGLLSLGRMDPDDEQEPLNMAYLALRGSNYVNGVSQLHGEVSRRIFQPLFPRWPAGEVPVTSVTNGVHMPSWDSEAADKLWSESCGKGRWLGTLDTIVEELKRIPDDIIWRFRLAESKQLIHYVRQRLARQLASEGNPAPVIAQSEQWLDPDVLTIGFARRFTGYKRPNLLLHDPERLARMLHHPQWPVQLIIAGKAHPQDEEGKDMIRAWSEFVSRPDIRPHIIFLADYDMALAQQMVQGVDLWINTPRRPWEACGTSGMKVLVNGGLNLSEKDGWWAEAYQTGLGWAIGDGQEHGDDPEWDCKEAEQLYRLLEEEAIPCFYNRNAEGIPVDWVASMRRSMAELTPRFSTNRMLREYVERLYLPALSSYNNRTADGSRKAEQLCQWCETLRAQWPQVHFGKLETGEENGYYSFQVIVYLDNLPPDAVAVQLFAEPRDGEQPEVHPMTRGHALAGTVNGYLFTASIPAKRPVSDYTPRVIPFFEGAQVPQEATEILWYE